MSQKFLYFGYGSNMLAKRIHKNSPSAVRIGYGMLEEWELDFKGFTNYWQGAPATIMPVEGASVFGTVWEMDVSNLGNLDAQEGVNHGHYYAANLPIIFENGNYIIARVYIMVEQPTTPLRSFAIENIDIPFDRRPSKTYIQCMVKGAVETGIPMEYVEMLKSIKHNGRITQELENQFELKHIKLSS